MDTNNMQWTCTDPSYTDPPEDEDDLVYAPEWSNEERDELIMMLEGVTL